VTVFAVGNQSVLLIMIMYL